VTEVPSYKQPLKPTLTRYSYIHSLTTKAIATQPHFNFWLSYSTYIIITASGKQHFNIIE